ncbi:MAG: hypothetical protein JW822_10245 [Spirochaetales bacterium]|nr:hypothetical protein [Spirochaetales bacterium]
MNRFIVFFTCLFVFLAGALFAQTPDDSGVITDDDPFSDSSDIIVPKEDVEDDAVTEQLEKESVTLTGEIQGQFGYYFNRDFFSDQPEFDDNMYKTLLGADLMLDVRLRKGFKAFANLSVGYVPQGLPVTHNYTGVGPGGAGDFFLSEDSDLALILKEIFMDMNIGNLIYFRLGKQVLVWGRGYFWNPTDLLNRDKKNIADMEERREGIYGLKVQIPFGTALTLYGFIDATGAEDISDFAFAGKAEFTVGNVEMGLSAWGKKNDVPVFGFDISTSLLDVDIWAEASLSYGDNVTKMNTDGSLYRIEEELVPRVCVGLRKYFDFLDVADRIMLMGEFYYNYAGYDENMFEELSTVNLEVFKGAYYDTNNYGQYYAALFFSLSRFLVTDMSLNITVLGNFSDLSATVFAGVSYTPVYDFTLTFDLIGFVGDEDREYTYSGSVIGALLTLSMVF